MKNIKNRKSIIKGSNKKEMLFLSIYTMIIVSLYLVGQFKIMTYFSIALALLFCIYKTHLGLCIFIISNLFITQTMGSKIQILMLIPVMLFMLLKCYKKYTGKDIIILILCTFGIIISCLLGYQPNLITALLMLLSIFTYSIMTKYCKENGTASIAFSYFLSAIGLSLVVLYNFAINGISSLTYGRLNFGGDIKGLAISAAIPLLFIILSKMENKKVFDLKISNLWIILISLAYIITIFLTYSRGVIIAIFIAILVELIINKNKGKSFKYAIIILMAVGILFYFTIDSSVVRTNRLIAFDEYGSANGRTEIWKGYIDMVLSYSPLSPLFGLGSGNIGRVSSTGYYAHSTFLDFFFSYGVIGFVSFILFELNILKNTIKSKQGVLISISIALIVMYLTHGDSANLYLFMIEGLLISILFCKGEKENEA